MKYCKKAKSKVLPHELYTPLPIPNIPWQDISMNFVLGLPRSWNGHEFIFAIVDRFYKVAYFIPYHKVDDGCLIANLLYKEVVRLHGLPSSVISD